MVTMVAAVAVLTVVGFLAIAGQAVGRRSW